MRVTIKHIAEHLHISPATVSRVLNGQALDFISDDTRCRVMEAARSLGYRRNAAARALVTGRTNMVALWLHNRYSFNAFVGQVVHTMMSVVHGTPIELLVAYLGQPDPREADWTPLSQWPVDGILAHEAPQFVTTYRLGQAHRASPIVGMGCWFDPRADYVGVDLREGVSEAVQHLLSRSPRRVAYLVNTESNTPGEPRLDAYTAGMEGAGIEPETILCDQQSRASARERIVAYAAENTLPGAIFCHNDDLAIGAYRALSEIGARVPEDVALVGCDGIEDSQYLPCALSTIVQPVDAMCSRAWAMLHNRLAHPNAPHQGEMLQARLCVRESSGH